MELGQLEKRLLQILLIAPTQQAITQASQIGHIFSALSKFTP
jgi:hypothetical protein